MFLSLSKSYWCNRDLLVHSWNIGKQSRTKFNVFLESLKFYIWDLQQNEKIYLYTTGCFHDKKLSCCKGNIHSIQNKQNIRFINPILLFFYEVTSQLMLKGVGVYTPNNYLSIGNDMEVQSYYYIWIQKLYYWVVNRVIIYCTKEWMLTSI